MDLFIGRIARGWRSDHSKDSGLQHSKVAAPAILHVVSRQDTTSPVLT